MNNKFRVLTLLITISLLISSCGQNKIKVKAQVSEPSILSVEDGPRVDIPSNALSKNSTAYIEMIEYPSDVESGTYQISGDVFEFSVPDSPAFNDIVTLVIPYDPKDLPDDIPEANIFVSYLVDGEWVRLIGEVNEEANSVEVQILHNGIYSTGFDTIVDIGVETREYLGILAGPTNLEEARLEVARREAEVLREWNLLQIRVEQYDENLRGEPLREFVKKNFKETVAILAADGLAYGLAGESGLLVIGGHTVGAWGGYIALGASAGLYIGPIMGSTVLELRSLYRWMDARIRLEEARAVLQSFEHPTQTDFYGDFGVMLQEWTDIQTEINPDGSDSIDWTRSSIPLEPELSISFDTENPEIVNGQCANISWNVSGGYSKYVSINGDIQDTEGSTDVCPEDTTSYDLMIYGRYDELLVAPETVTIEVSADPNGCDAPGLTSEEKLNCGAHNYDITTTILTSVSPARCKFHPDYPPFGLTYAYIDKVSYKREDTDYKFVFKDNGLYLGWSSHTFYSKIGENEYFMIDDHEVGRFSSHSDNTIIFNSSGFKAEFEGTNIYYVRDNPDHCFYETTATLID